METRCGGVTLPFCLLRKLASLTLQELVEIFKKYLCQISDFSIFVS